MRLGRPVMRRPTRGDWRGRVIAVLWLAFLLWIEAWPVGAAHPSEEVALARAGLGKGDLEAAEAALHRARFADPDDPRLVYNLGVVQYRKRNYLDAARSFGEAAQTTTDPTARADALHNLGNAAYRAARFQEAVGAYQASLEIREDALTRFNLEQAKKRLQEEMERRAQPPQDQSQQGPGQSGRSGQDQPQPGQAGQQQGGDGASQGGNDRQQGGQPDPQSGTHSADGRSGQPGQPGQDGKDGKDGRDGRDGKDGQTGQDQASRPGGDEQKPGDQAQAPRTQTGSGTPDAGLASDTAEAGDEGNGKREDLAMAEPGKEKPPPADISQRARAMKNIKLNAFAVEKLLRDLEEREKEVQRRYRRDPQRDDSFDEEFDPFFMTPDQVRDFIDRRSGRRAQPKSDTPDW